MFIFVWLGNMMINLDHGSIPAATKEIKKDLKLNNAELGRLGSIVFGGLVFGSVFAAVVFNKWSYKFVLSVSYLGNAIGLFIFATYHHYYLQAFARFLSGFNQMLHQVYVPVFVDAYGTSQNKSFWMSFMMICPSLGVIMGYELTAFTIFYSNWKVSILAISFVSFLCFVVISMFPSKYIEIHHLISAIKQEEVKRFMDPHNSGKSGIPEVGGTGEKYLSNLARFES